MASISYHLKVLSRPLYVWERELQDMPYKILLTTLLTIS